MKLILCLVLGVYSVAMGTYALSEFYTAYGCVQCFKGETAFPGGAGSSGNTRNVNVQYRASGPNGFTGADGTRMAGALNTAMNNWNTQTDGNGNTTPFRFQPAQGAPASNVNVEVILVDDLRGAPRTACMQLQTWKDQNGAIAGGRLYVRRSAFNNMTEAELSELIQHELGHFIGLADYYGNPDQCDTTMAQAEAGCRGLRGTGRISQRDVSTVNRYVANSGNCSRPRVSRPLVDSGGGYIDPTPSPIYYPRTCYYYYDAVDLYWCYDGCRYIGTVYYLTDVFCTY